ncbi:uncharacterized protein LTR77_005805 [Saxophila tyrrhenica]|uniref:GDS1 winged helix domain-containing protein n=1 Tax=Saxophila tyrrhenica TaxID=1690608 RepID=A0AAV9PA56_9PEZI|nr:hypothetical protein LTR77_005805 [Saxophila tyrrhenica]
MGYNTRRKSLSLTELGITLPKRARTQSHPSPPSTIAESDENDRPSKKSRLMSPPAIKEKSKAAAQLSPPPSPVREGSSKVSVEGINDDIVIGTIQQLEQTGNRPHLVKELATVLATNLHSVEKSANPTALISSRLTQYLNRPWPTISPCPLAKDLSPVHPRRLYFFLTTLPRQPIPDTIEQPPKTARIISPSLSSASNHDEDVDPTFDRDRHALSPSPEVDLSSPELEDNNAQEPPTPGAPFSGRNSVTRDRSASAPNRQNGRRGASPQLEHEERDFKMTANALYEQERLRRYSSSQSQSQAQDVQMAGSGSGSADAVTGSAAEQERPGSVARSIEEETQEMEFQNHEDANALFGHAGQLKLMELENQGMGEGMFSSPMMAPQHSFDEREGEVVLGASQTSQPESEQRIDAMHLDHPHGRDGGKEGGLRLDVEFGALADWEEEVLQSPEKIAMAELEGLFDAY